MYSARQTAAQRRSPNNSAGVADRNALASRVTSGQRSRDGSQQVDGGATGADEHKLRRNALLRPVGRVFDSHTPATIRLALQPDDLALVPHRETVLRGKLRDKKMRQRAVIDVRAGDDARGRRGLTVGAPLHDQRRPFSDLCRILAVFHAMVAMVGGHLPVAFAQERDVRGTPDKAHVRNWMDEGARIRDRTLADETRPKLPRDVEFGIDLERLGNVDRAIRALRRAVRR